MFNLKMFKLSRRSIINLKYKWMWFLDPGLSSNFTSNQRYNFYKKTVFIILLVLIILLLHRKKEIWNQDSCGDSFIGFRIRSGIKVPDIIHFYRNEAESSKISRIELMCIQAALRTHKNVMVHSENAMATQNAFISHNFKSDSLQILSAPHHSKIPPVINILWNHGGIFLQNDIYLMRRLDSLRIYDKVKSKDGSVVAGNKEGIDNSWSTDSSWTTVDGVVLEKDFGALYLTQALRNCSIKAIRLSDIKNRLSWLQNYV